MKMKIHELSAKHIFPSKRYTTYECITELAVTVPSDRSTVVKKIKRFIIWLCKWSRVTFTELLSAVVKIPWRHHHFRWLFHDFPRPLLFSMTFQAWKMVFLHYMTFHDQRHPGKRGARFITKCMFIVNTIIKPHWLYAGPSCMICHFWLFAEQCKSIANQRKLLYFFLETKWRFAWVMSWISTNQTAYTRFMVTVRVRVGIRVR